MKDLAYYNGKITTIDEMKIPINDRAVFFGDGVYDATVAANHKLFDIDNHIDRFFRSMEKVAITPPIDRETLIAEIQRCVDMIDSSDTLFVYWQATRGTSKRNFTFPSTSANIMIYIYETSLTDLRNKWKVITKEDTRHLHCDIKTIDLLPAVMASEDAKKNCCDEVIFHRNGRVTECAHNNVNILKDGVFITPPADNLILPGTARKRFIEICKRLNVVVEERVFTLEELFAADEIMITCSATYGVGVSHIDGREVGGKDNYLLDRLQRAFVDDFIKDTGYIPDIL